MYSSGLAYLYSKKENTSNQKFPEFWIALTAAHAQRYDDVVTKKPSIKTACKSSSTP